MAQLIKFGIVSTFLVLALALPMVVHADWKEDIEVLKAEIKPCALYSVTENQISYGTSFQLLGYKNAELNAMYSNQADMIALGLGYEITSLEDIGVNVPIAKYFTVSSGLWVGSRDFTSKDRYTEWGCWATIVKLTF